MTDSTFLCIRMLPHNVIITRDEADDNLSIEDFAGKSFGVVPASSQSLFLEAWNKTKSRK